DPEALSPRTVMPAGNYALSLNRSAAILLGLKLKRKLQQRLRWVPACAGTSGGKSGSNPSSP
ncbi:hypothetical protein, partial [Pseudorhodoplanes sp.]|uniref:hypothetical protein n=1 Tax=Pseudorhodoplanes sp. TaxID=1934341 RepID=UPI002D16CE72